MSKIENAQVVDFPWPVSSQDTHTYDSCVDTLGWDTGHGIGNIVSIVEQ